MASVSSRVEAVRVDVWGGLGNRLFMIAAGVVESGELGVPLTLASGAGFDDVSSLLGGLDRSLLCGAHLLSQDLLGVPGSTVTMRRRIVERVAGLARSHIPHLQEDTGAGRRTTRHIRAVPTRVLHGYFQDLELVRRAAKFGWPSTVLLTEESFAALESLRSCLPNRYVGLHLRRGDYLLSVNQRKLGLPSLGYYRSAVAAISSQRSASLPLVIFTDAPEEAGAIAEAAGLTVEAIVGPSDTQNEAQALWLLSRADGLVISNSTFGWWGAFWGRPNRPVACPAPWHNRVNSQALVDPRWIQIPK